jgi:hypothetical protein
MKLEQYQKAIAAAAVPVAISILMWIQSGTLNAPELSTALAGLFAALVVYAVPNAPAQPRHEDEQKPGPWPAPRK